MTEQRRTNLLDQVAMNRRLWDQFPRDIVNDEARGVAAAMFAQIQWSHDVLEEMLRDHVSCAPTQAANQRAKRKRP